MPVRSNYVLFPALVLVWRCSRWIWAPTDRTCNYWGRWSHLTGNSLMEGETKGGMRGWSELIGGMRSDVRVDGEREEGQSKEGERE